MSRTDRVRCRGDRADTTRDVNGADRESHESPGCSHQTGRATLTTAPAHLLAKRTVVAILILCLVALMIRFVVFLSQAPVGLVGDEEYYLAVAANIADGSGHTWHRGFDALRPPAHPWLLATAAGAFDSLNLPGDHGAQTSAVLLQLLLSTLLVGLCGLLAGVVWDYREAVVAGSIAAVYPELVAYSHFLWSETLFSVFICTYILLLLVTIRVDRGKVLLVVLAGVALGAAALTRELAIPAGVATCVALTVSGPRGGRTQRALILAVSVIVAAGVVFPWTARNAARFGRIVPVSTIGWFAVREGNTLTPSGGVNWIQPDLESLGAFRREYFGNPDEMGRTDFAREQALDLIAAEQPGWIVKKLTRAGTLLLAPDSFIFKKMSRGSYGELDGWGHRLVVAVTVLSHLALLTGVLLSLAMCRSGVFRRLTAGVFSVVLMVHVVANASSRFRVPWLPLMIVASAFAVCHRHDVIKGLRTTRGVCAALLIVLLQTWLVFFMWPDLLALWETGRYVIPGRP